MVEPPNPQRIGTRWVRRTAPFARLLAARPVPTSAADTVLSGTTEAGTAYQLRYASRRLRVRHDRLTIALVLRRDAVSCVSGPPLARGELSVATQVHSEEPRETVFFGQLPPPGARFQALLGDEQPLSADVSAPVENGCRLFVLGLPGTAQRLSARVVDEFGSELARESIELGFDPCTNSTDGASGTVITHPWGGLAY